MQGHRNGNGTEKTGRTRSYRDELSLRDSRAVDDAFSGGAFGCPGEYFRGAAALDCRGGFKTRCRRCWGSPYGDEEWIREDQRDE